MGRACVLAAAALVLALPGVAGASTLPGEAVDVRPTSTPIDRTPPVLSRLRIVPSTFRKGSKLPKLAAKEPPTGGSIRFALTEAARVRLGFDRVRLGRRVGGRCLRPTFERRNRKRCTRYANVRTAVFVVGRPGSNRVRFHGRLTHKKSLAPGRYRLTARATDGVGNRSRPARKRFRLL